MGRGGRGAVEGPPATAGGDGRLGIGREPKPVRRKESPPDRRVASIVLPIAFAMGAETQI